MAEADQDNRFTQVADENWSAYVRGRDSGHLEYLEDAEKFNRYYYGDQWDKEDKDKLEEQGRPALTINQALPTINTVLGEQATTRVSVKLKPQRNATYQDAKILDKLITFILDDQEYQDKESEVFADGLIQDRGFFDVRMNFESNELGDVQVTTENPNDVVLDPDAKEYDPSTWTEVTKTRWLSIDAIESTYGEEAAEKVKGVIAARNDFAIDAFIFSGTFGNHDMPGRYVVQGDRERQLKSVRVVERQHKKLTKCYYFVTSFGDKFIVPEYMDAETRDRFAVEQGYSVVQQRGFKIRWTVTAGEDVLLHDEWSPYPWFTIVPFFPYFRRGKPFGMMRNIVSPQDQLNKLSSQELHIVNTTANSGWIVEEHSLGDGLTLEDIESQGSKTGFVISFKQGRTPPQKIQPNQVPTGIDRLAQKAQLFIRDISGISASMQGNASPYTSARAVQDQIQRSQVQIQSPMKNLMRTRRMVVDRVLWLIQTYYTEQRVFHIGTDLEPGVTDEELMINQQTAEGLVNDVTSGKYKVTVTQQPIIDNYQDAQRQELLEYRAQGVMIPDHLIIKYSNLQDKDELADILKRAAGLHEPSPEEQELAEFQRQAQIQSIQLDLAKKQAQVEELMSKVDYTNAQTASEIDPNAISNVIEIMKLQADIQKNIDNLSARLKMSQMANQAAMQRSGTQNLTQMRGQDIQSETAITTAALQQQLRNPPNQSNEGE